MCVIRNEIQSSIYEMKSKTIVNRMTNKLHLFDSQMISNVITIIIIIDNRRQRRCCRRYRHVHKNAPRFSSKICI